MAKKIARPKKDVLDEKAAGLRENLLRAGLHLFAEKGFAATSTREIAREAGCNLSLINYYFGGKEGLYEAVFLEKIGPIRDSLPEAYSIDPAQMGLDRKGFFGVLTQLIALNVHSYLADPAFGRLMHREVLDGVPYARNVLDGMLLQMLESLTRLVEWGKGEGFLREDVHAPTSLMLLSRAIDGYLAMVDALRGRSDVTGLLMDPQVDTEGFTRQVVELFLRGLERKEP